MPGLQGRGQGGAYRPGHLLLKPKVPEKTEHITVVSVVGRFLEHSRIYRFGRRGQRREALYRLRRLHDPQHPATGGGGAPVYDEDAKNRLRHIFDTIMLDDEKGKEQQADGSYTDRHINAPPLNSQEVFYEEAYGRPDGPERGSEDKC